MEQDGDIVEAGIGGLGMFVGEFSHSLDPKKRLTIPSIWRDQTGQAPSLYVLPDFHLKCLNVFPSEAMTRRLEVIRSKSMSDSKAMEFARVLGAASDLVVWDSQGRIRIKDKLLDFAGLTDRVVMIGALDRFELWNPGQRPLAVDIDQAGLVEAGRHVGF